MLSCPLRIVRHFSLWLICFSPVVAVASGGGDISQMSKEAPTLSNYLFAGAILGLGFFLHRTLKQLDDNNQKQWTAIGESLERLNKLEGEHGQRGMFCPAVHLMERGLNGTKDHHHARIEDIQTHSHRRSSDERVIAPDSGD